MIDWDIIIIKICLFHSSSVSIYHLQRYYSQPRHGGFTAFIASPSFRSLSVYRLFLCPSWTPHSKFHLRRHIRQRSGNTGVFILRYFTCRSCHCGGIARIFAYIGVLFHASPPSYYSAFIFVHFFFAKISAPFHGNFLQYISRRRLWNFTYSF